MPEEQRRAALARAVTQQRTSLGLSVRKAATVAGISRATWASLEDGSRVTQDRHYGAIERALQWPAGEIIRILSASDQSAADAARQRFKTMSREELAMHILDFAEARGAKEAADLLERILAIRAETQQRT